ncbi:MAG: lipid-A-disaccharide synthase [Rhodospirillaceae bacterium]|nr:lipid-A-disaccharide synthase [Rhodospirillaceae bacterium]MBT5359168.1 lipid-A-disaccharide synthase [Rhodospirillaceae bacterium]MBT5769038.1 lipid-A-disaccharide synthase [Rhodospirillaceae bacterium]MBT6310611.1 lipid-A-disaccharide synthase [Rhodospirillaceae bacterium]MBT7364719.1 lipid-A-disaccharide synthase [Rhodospirillaceae bacterium]
MPGDGLHVYVIAGEPSGDVIGARLIEALTAAVGPDLRVSGVGGPEMEAAGLKSLFAYGELAIMGLFEVLPSVPRLLRRMRLVAKDIERLKPDVIVTIDSPGFVFGVIRRLRSRDCPRVHYVAPTIWAWRAGRVRKFHKHFDHLLALFPFEPPLFDAAGLASTFVGHPVAEGGVDDGDGAAFRARHGIAPDATVLCVLPGSRHGEVSRLEPIARETLARVMPDHPDVVLVVPAAANVRSLIEETVATWPWPVAVVDGARERYDAFAAADLALATSGTVTLELSWAAVPTVVMYRLPRLTGEIARRMIRVRFASIVNIVADREVLPEFIQSRCRPKPIAGAVRELLSNPQRRAEIGAEARRISRDLEPGGERPSARAARAVLDIVAAARNR